MGKRNSKKKPKGSQNRDDRDEDSGKGSSPGNSLTESQKDGQSTADQNSDDLMPVKTVTFDSELDDIFEEEAQKHEEEMDYQRLISMCI